MSECKSVEEQMEDELLDQYSGRKARSGGD